ncbi:MAG: VanZ family protein [Gemmatimonadota bacterium]
MAAQPSPADSPLGALGARARRAALVGWAFALAWLTLTPVPRASGSDDEPMSTFCVVCGDRGTADAILNVALFMPLGLAFVRRRRPLLTALAAGLGVSLGIELVQIAVPGRYPTFGDVVWNGLGAGAGTLALLELARHVAAPSPRAGRAAALLVGGGLALAGWLLGHAPTRATYYGQWTADLGHMPAYEGTLVSASLDGLAVPNTMFDESVRAPERIAEDWTLEARVVKGPPPPAVSPIVSVYDSAQAEILLLGAHGEDLVLRERTRAKAMLLDHPDLRLEGVLAAADGGDTVVLGARRQGDGRCLSVGNVERCGLGFTPGRTWGLLLYLEGPSEGARRVVDVGWLFALLLCVGALSGTARRSAVDGLLVAAAVAAAVGLTRLVVPPWWEIVGALTGLASGLLAVRAATAWVRRAGTS